MKSCIKCKHFDNSYIDIDMSCATKSECTYLKKSILFKTIRALSCSNYNSMSEKENSIVEIMNSVNAYEKATEVIDIEYKIRKDGYEKYLNEKLTLIHKGINDNVNCGRFSVGVEINAFDGSFEKSHEMIDEIIIKNISELGYKTRITDAVHLHYEQTIGLTVSWEEKNVDLFARR